MTLRILAFVPYPTGRVPGQRYRIEQWAPHLAARGVALHFSPFLDARSLDVLYARGRALSKAWTALRGHLRRWRQLRTVSNYDAAFVYREAALLGGPWIERRLCRRLPFVYDFDDAIYLRQTSVVNARAAFLKPQGKVETLCRLASQVTVGNETLAAFARANAAAVTVVPSTIDTDLYRPPERSVNPRPVVGWTGTHTTLPYLEALAPALLRLRRRLDYRLRVIGTVWKLPGLDIECLPWSAETEVADLSLLDVGLMPLNDDAWSRGKCGMKALQYMGLGIPPVVSPVGVNAELVTDGVSGLHARTEDDWVERLTLLLNDSALRRRLGLAARATVERHYSCRVHAPRMAQVLLQAATLRATCGTP